MTATLPAALTGERVEFDSTAGRLSVYDYRGTTMINQRTNWRIEVFPTRALPHFEMPEQFVAAYVRFSP